MRAQAAHRSLYVEQRPAPAGPAMLTIMVDDPEAAVARIAARGRVPAA